MMQAYLRHRGFTNNRGLNIGVDGNFGPSSKEALIKFQIIWGGLLIMKRKITSLLLVCVMLILPLAGCGKETASVETQDPSKQGKVFNIYC
jgi:hypothetical protein